MVEKILTQTLESNSISRAFPIVYCLWYYVVLARFEHNSNSNACSNASVLITDYAQTETQLLSFLFTDKHKLDMLFPFRRSRCDPFS